MYLYFIISYHYNAGKVKKLAMPRNFPQQLLCLSLVLVRYCLVLVNLIPLISHSLTRLCPKSSFLYVTVNTFAALSVNSVNGLGVVRSA